MSSFIYNSFFDDVFRGNIDVGHDSFYCMLVTSKYVPNKDNHTKRGDISNEVPNGNGYVTGGMPVNVSVGVFTNDKFNTILDGASWPNATITAAGAVYYKYISGELVAFIDFEEDVSSINGTFNLTSSILRIQN